MKSTKLDHKIKGLKQMNLDTNLSPLGFSKINWAKSNPLEIFCKTKKIKQKFQNYNSNIC